MHASNTGFIQDLILFTHSKTAPKFFEKSFVKQAFNTPNDLGSYVPSFRPCTASRARGRSAVLPRDGPASASPNN